MATRTPTVQARSQHHRDWGNYANGTTALPNQSANPLASDTFGILEVGDTAYAAGARYTCTAVGTVGGGDAVWATPGGGGTITADVLGTFSAGNQLDAGAGDLPGVQTGFLASVLCELTRVNTAGGQGLFRNSDFGVDGWAIAIEGNLQFEVSFCDGITPPMVFARNLPLDVERDSLFVGLGLVLVVLRVVPNGLNNDIELWVQGRHVLMTAGAGPIVPAAGAPQIGVGPFGNVAAETGILGVQYLDGTLTDDQLREHFAACLAAVDVVDPPGQGWTSWSVKRGAPGATWAPSDGVGPTFTRTGVLTTTTRPAARFLG
jgi:hypothetical protein